MREFDDEDKKSLELVTETITANLPVRIYESWRMAIGGPFGLIQFNSKEAYSIAVHQLKSKNLIAGFSFTEPKSINWLQDEWFRDNHSRNVTSEFENWWISFYGFPEDYETPDDEDAIHEYFTRASFALMGWMACKGRGN